MQQNLSLELAFAQLKLVLICFAVIAYILIKVWSNGRFRNVKHRVQCKEATIRLSIASFLLGPKEALVEAPPELVDTEHPRLYVPFAYKDYRQHRVTNNLHAGEALDLVRVNSSQTVLA